MMKFHEDEFNQNTNDIELGDRILPSVFICLAFRPFLNCTLLVITIPSLTSSCHDAESLASDMSAIRSRAPWVSGPWRPTTSFPCRSGTRKSQRPGTVPQFCSILIVHVFKLIFERANECYESYLHLIIQQPYLSQKKKTGFHSTTFSSQVAARVRVDRNSDKNSQRCASLVGHPGLLALPSRIYQVMPVVVVLYL